MSKATELAYTTMTLARILSLELEKGELTEAEARVIHPIIHEAEGWLLSARKFLDPSDPINR